MRHGRCAHSCCASEEGTRSVLRCGAACSHAVERKLQRSGHALEDRRRREQQKQPELRSTTNHGMPASSARHRMRSLRDSLERCGYEIACQTNCLHRGDWIQQVRRARRCPCMATAAMKADFTESGQARGKETEGKDTHMTPLGHHRTKKPCRVKLTAANQGRRRLTKEATPV
jgi:hypothetical protein